MPVVIFSHKDISEVKKNAQDKLLTLFSEYKNQPILFLSAGGSALSLLDTTKEALSFSYITITVVDERFSTAPSVNNFLQVQNTSLYTSIIKKDGKSISTIPLDNETIAECRDRFEKNLMRWREDNPNGLIITTLGMGEDGHIAGIMPYPDGKEEFKKIFEQKRLIISYDAQDKNKFRNRITTSFYFLREYVDHAIVYITRDSKQEAYRRLTDTHGELYITPARIIHEMKQVNVFTDRI